MKIAAQMDHISSISIEGDTTFALLLEAQKRGYELYHYTPDTLSLEGEKTYAWVEKLVLRDEKRNHYAL